MEQASMRALLLIAATVAPLAVSLQLMPASSADPATHAGYIGFDRNDYPGDSNLKILRRTFSYSGYWLNDPPGAKQILGVENERSSKLPDSASWFSSTDAHMRRSKRPATRSSWAYVRPLKRTRKPNPAAWRIFRF